MFVKIKNKIIRFCLLYCLMVFCILLVSCSEEEEKNLDSLNVPVVKGIKVEFSKLNDDLNSFGTISYKTKNNVSALVEGTIEKILVKEGDYVRKGQVIAQLRNVQLEIQKEQAQNSLEAAKVGLYQAEVNLQEQKLNIESKMISLQKNELRLIQTKLELEESETELENNRKLLEVGGITETSFRSMEIAHKSKETDYLTLEKEIEIAKIGYRDIDLIAAGFEISSNPDKRKEQLIELNTRNAIASVENQKVQLASAEKNLISVEKLIEELTIKSPVDGIVCVLYFENGEFVPENEKILTLMDIVEVNAVFSIQEQDIQYFHIGDALTVDIPSINQSVVTKISEISPIADSTSGNFTVKALISNKDEKIKPGMFVKCNVQRNERTKYACVPETVIIKKDGNVATVFSIVNGFVVLKEITIKTQKDGNIWVETGLKETDLLVNKPSPFLKEGEKVEVL